MTDTRQINIRRLAESRDQYKAALTEAEIPLIADTIWRAGWHPYRGHGLALLEILVRRHREQPHPPMTPNVMQDDVIRLADERGFDPDFEPTRRPNI